jgi:hypothetical protein
VPEATYLAWLDCHALDLPCSAGGFFLDHARVGRNFGGTRAAISGRRAARCLSSRPPSELTSVVRRADRHTGVMICGVIMLVGGVIGMALMSPESERMRWREQNARGGSRT